jgi:hypothetical protein
MEPGRLYLYDNIQIKSEVVEEAPQPHIEDLCMQRFNLWTTMGQKAVDLMNPVFFHSFFTIIQGCETKTDEWTGLIPKTLAELFIGGYFDIKDKIELKKTLNQSNWRGKDGLMINLLAMKPQIVPEPQDMNYLTFKYFCASTWRVILRFFCISLADCKRKGATKTLREKFHVPLPVYFGSLLDVYQRDLGLKQISDMEGHTSLVVKHTIEDEAALYPLGFPKGWSIIQQGLYGARIWFHAIAGFKEKFPSQNYKDCPTLKPKLFTLKYELQTETLYICCDVKPFHSS